MLLIFIKFLIYLIEFKHLKEIGTIGWRAKEVINSEEKNLSADIFSLGCIFYYIYNSGIHPFGEM